MTLEDSTTYQWIFQQGEARGEARGESQGRIQEARSLLLLQARRRFGQQPAAEASLQQVADSDRLRRMAERIFDAVSWDDLLATA